MFAVVNETALPQLLGEVTEPPAAIGLPHMPRVRLCPNPSNQNTTSSANTTSRASSTVKEQQVQVGSAPA